MKNDWNGATGPAPGKSNAEASVDPDLANLFEPPGRQTLLRVWLDGLENDPICGKLAAAAEVRSLCGRFLDAMARAVRDKPWDPASPHFRDAVKALAFIGGWLGEQKARPSWAALMTAHLRRSMRRLLGDRPVPDDLVGALETMGAAAVETFFATVRQNQRHAVQETLRRTTPVLRLPDNVPTLLVVGDPDREVINELIDRLLVETVRRDASQYMVDVSGHQGDPENLCRSLVDLSEYKRMRDRQLVLVGAEPSFVERLKKMGFEPENLALSRSVEEALNAISELD